MTKQAKEELEAALTIKSNIFSQDSLAVTDVLRKLAAATYYTDKNYDEAMKQAKQTKKIIVDKLGQLHAGSP